MSALTRVIRDIDVTRPTTPTGLTGTPVSETQINLTWNASTDPQGAANEALTGVIGYRLYRNGSLRIDQAGTSFNDTGLTAFTSYSYRVTAYDAAANESVQSSAITPSTLDTTAPSTPAISAAATSSSAITVSLASASTDAGSGVASYTLQRATDSGFTANLTTTNGLTAGSFPLSVSGLSAATQYFFRLRAVDGSSNTGSFSTTANATTQGAVAGDWTTRSTAAGVRAAWALALQSDLTTYYWPGGNGIAPVLDAAIKPSGQPASARFITQGLDGEGNVNMTFPFGPYVAGDVFWVSYRVRLDYDLAYQPFLRSDNGSHSDMKTSIVSRYGSAGSFQQFEVVSAQNNQCDNLVSGYWQGLVGVDQSFIQWDTTKSMLPSGSDIMYQPELDRGSNPLTGTNPDTGAAWSTSEQQRARYGYPYNLSQNASDRRMGIGDPIGGYFRFYAGEFITITQRIDCRGFGSGNNTSALTVWAARDGQPYVKLLDKTGITFGGSGPFDGLWLTNFCTKRDGAASANRRITGRTTNITGVTLRNVGNGTSTGNGTLTYNASTGRFTFAAQGESAGTARGWSAQKTLLNLASSGSNSWLGVEVTGTLPGSNQSDNVTIATGRNDTYSNYSEVIVSEQEIKAPGGFRAIPISTLETAAASLAEGQRVQLSQTGLNATLISDEGLGGTVIEYGPRGMYDPTRKQIFYMGQSHASGSGRQKELTFDLASNSWSYVFGPDTGIAHLYYMVVVNQRNGTRYMLPYDSNPTVRRKRIGETSWTNVTPVPLKGNFIGALEHNKDLNSGAGGLVWCDDRGIYTSNSTVSSWTTRLSLNRGGWLHNFSATLNNRGESYCGGGDSTSDSNLRWWRVNSAGTVTEMPALPKQMGVSGKAIVVPHPNGTHLLAFGGTAGDKAVTRFDPVAQTWSSNLGNHSFGQNGNGDWIWYATMHELGVIFVMQTLGGGSPTAWLYKPHTV